LPSLYDVATAGKYRHTSISSSTNTLKEGKFINDRAKAFSMSAPGWENEQLYVNIEYNKDVYTRTFLGAEIQVPPDVYHVNWKGVANEFRNT
jgi:hypothetical protein